MADLADVRIFIPRIRRELDPGMPLASAAAEYSDDMLKDVAADAVGELYLIGGTAFNYSINIASATPASAFSPDQWEYYTDPEVPLPLHNLVAIQAALTQLYRDAQAFKTQEKISDEGSSWEVQRSATLMRERINAMLRRRQEILEQLKYENPQLVTDAFVNLLQERTPSLDVFIEPYYYDGI
jgi:hypothetical protein